ncbi:MAG: hypothetical protein ACTHJM_16265, partial [Marmoricola sp.]
TMHFKATGINYMETYIENADNNTHSQDLYLQDLNGNTSSTIYLPAGHYSGYAEGDLYEKNLIAAAGTTQHISGSGTASITFVVPGSASSGPSGKASTYVTMAHSRTCSSASLRTTITKNTTNAKAISKVVYSVNGHAAKTVYARSIKPGLVVTLTKLAAASSAKVAVTVYLKNGTHVSESATYAACSV